MSVLASGTDNKSLDDDNENIHALIAEQQPFESLHFTDTWDDDRKAEFAYRLLHSVPTVQKMKVMDRLQPFLYRDIVGLLPYELAIRILSYVTELSTLIQASQVSRKWHQLCKEQMLWRLLFESHGWTYDASAMTYFLTTGDDPFKSPPVRKYRLLCSKQLDRDLPLQSVPIQRTRTPLYYNHLPSSRASGQRNYLSMRLRERRSETLTSREVDNNQDADPDTPMMEPPSDQTSPTAESAVVPSVKRSSAGAVPRSSNLQLDNGSLNWRQLYKNRRLIEQRWQFGDYVIKPIPLDILEHHHMHSQAIYCIQFDNDKIVSGSRDTTIKIWDTRTGHWRKTLNYHDTSVLCLQYDDRWILSGSSDALIIQSCVKTGQVIHTLRGHSDSVLRLRFVGNRLLSCSKDRTLRVWDLAQGVCTKVLLGHRAAVNACQMYGDQAVSGSGDRSIRLWDMNSGECLRMFEGHTRGIACVDFDGTYIASGSSDHTIRLWNAKTGEMMYTLQGHSSLVRTLQMDVTMDRIVSGSYDGNIMIWSISKGQLQRTLDRAITGRILNLAFDYARIVCCSNTSKIVLYDFAHDIDHRFFL
ncbi:WD40-repeat-containing domain protein [Radiomyces spectabilis]|uniref:WD40-repeat-containing domain protein n=1 Tax=Radiomyces spectabilis TaxID=64574 RepID=UPI0022202E43|nr:WD40-repeat-containing domain protein [Radiomyces spectabilis]KAI8371726.1 WD40-repeat-containing domain protein [Radiomyces spectabilis]